MLMIGGKGKKQIPILALRAQGKLNGEELDRLPGAIFACERPRTEAEKIRLLINRDMRCRSVGLGRCCREIHLFTLEVEIRR